MNTDRITLRERWENMKRTWHHRQPSGRLEAWLNYRRDKNGVETGVRRELVGRKYQQLQGLKVKK